MSTAESQLKNSFPASRKIYVSGKRYPSLRVPMRKVILSEPNAPLIVYDTSGPYTDPEVSPDLRKGLDRIRISWHERRGDTVRQKKEGGLRAKVGGNVTQMHYARKGVITEEMEYVAIRENQLMEAAADEALRAQHPGNSFGASLP